MAGASRRPAVTVRLEALTGSRVPDERRKLGYDVIEDSASRPAPFDGQFDAAAAVVGLIQIGMIRCPPARA
jgi:hypothetical protein